MELTLQPMSKARIAEFLVPSMREYVQHLIDSGMSPEAARKNADDTTAKSFPGGEAGNGNEIFDVMDAGEPVGILWIADQGDGKWFIYDIEMLEAKRGAGYGRATMLAAEDHVRAAGGTSLGLHVFGYNTVARGLYDSLGFEATNIQMRKAL
jgi:ribosomal protein S18 acetylase RimI-like enzyme